MNPSYLLPQYPNPYGYRFPGQGHINYVGWPHYSDVGLQFVYVQPQIFPQVPVLPCDSLLYAPTVPSMWRTRAPTLAPQVYQTLLNQHAVAAQQQNLIGHNLSRIARPLGSRGRPENVTCNTNVGAQNNNQSKIPLGENRINHNLRTALDEMSVIHQLRSNATLFGQKRKMRRRRRKPLDKEKQAASAGYADLSSINMEGTQARCKSELRTVDDENEVADQDYETCDEEDSTPKTNLNQTDSGGNRDSPRHQRTDHGDHASKDSSLFTSISNDKSYSHIAYNRDLVSVKSATVSRGKTFVVRRTEKKMCVSHDIFEDRCASEEIQHPFGDHPDVVDRLNQDYWAAVSDVESLWNATDQEIVQHVPICDKKNLVCRCKTCIENSNKRTRTKSSVVSTPTKGSIPSPDLWWDRSEYQWPFAEINDGNNNAVDGKTMEDDEYVVIELKQDENENKVSEECPRVVDVHESSQTMASNTSDTLPRRRLLSVDWESITRSRNDFESISTTSEDDAREKSRSITELDQAIVERGPLTTEPFALSPLVQASLNDTLKRLKSSTKKQGKQHRLVSETMQKNESRLLGTGNHLQTAFISQETFEERTKSAESPSKPDGPVLPVSTPRPSKIQAHTQKNAESSLLKPDGKKPPTPAYTQLNAPCLSVHPVDLTPHLNGNRSLQRSNSCPRKFTRRRLEGPNTSSLPRSSVTLQERDQVVQESSAQGPLIERKIVGGENILSKDAGKPEDEISKGKLLLKTRKGFDFPLNSDMFRKRACGISTLCPTNGAARAPQDSGLYCTNNKQFYEKSKPLPPSEPLDKKKSLTAPSSPTQPTTNLRKTSVSMSDLHNALERSTSRQNGKAKPSQFRDEEISIGGSDGVLPNPPETDANCTLSGPGVSVTGTNEKVKPRDAKLPTGLVFNSMLNDTIRRNFRAKSSPVAIFAVNQHQTIPKDSVIVRSPSIDDWSTIIVQPLSNSVKTAGGEATLSYRNLETVGRRGNGGKGVIRVSNPPRYLKLPVFVCPHDDQMARFVVPRRSRQSAALRRRNSLSTLHYSVLSKGVRQRRRREPSVQPQSILKSGNRSAINKTYPAFGTVRQTDRESSDLDKVDGKGQTEVPLRGKDHPSASSEVNSSELEGEVGRTTVAPHMSAPDTASQGCIVLRSETSSENKTLTTVAWERSAERAGPDTKSSKVNIIPPAANHKKSFLSFMKPKRQPKSSKATKKESDLPTGLQRETAGSNPTKRTRTKASRQDKIRASFVEKKNKLLGRDSKVRTKLAVSQQVVPGDCNANLEAPRPKELKNFESDGSVRNDKPSSASIRIPKEDRTVRSALYKPTFLCLAAIEGPAGGAEGKEHECSSKDDAEAFEDEPKLLPIATGRRSCRRSVVGTPGMRINSETGDVLEPSESKSLGTILSSTKILENDSTRYTDDPTV